MADSQTVDAVEGVDEELAKLAAPIRRLYDRALEEKEELLLRTAANKERLTKLAKALRAVDPTFEADKPKPQSRSRSNGTAWVPGPDKLAAAYEAVRDGDNGDGLTGAEVSELSGLSKPTTHAALHALRDRELIRRAGRKDGPGRPQLFKVLTDAVEIEGVTLNGGA